MAKPSKSLGRRSPTGRNGSNIKLNQNFSDRRKATKQERAMKRALYLSTLPKNRWKRLAYRMHPRRLANYWFSREGAIMGLKITGIGIIVCFFLIIGVFAYFRKDLPKIKGVAGDNLGGSITYYDRTGKVALWQDYDAVKRIPVDGDQISPYMKQATVAIEDKDFYKHGAFDVRGIARAGLNDVFGKGPIQGGSTISQQLVKLNEQWTDNRTITRKVKELILAVELEREYSKEDILTGYLNAAPYGGIENGVEVAARDYFATSAKDLTLAQASFLAGIPKSPSYYSPYSSSKWNSAISSTDGFGEKTILARQHYILDQMADQGYITKAQAKEAKAIDILAQVHPLKSKYNGIRAPYFVLAAKQELEKKYGAETIQRGGWKVITTVDLKLQSEAEKQVKKGLTLVKAHGGDNIAFVAEDVQTGQIVSLVGGVDFDNDQFGKINYAKTPLPPGSSFKPYDYGSLMQETGAGAGSVLYDTQAALPGWPCTDKRKPKYAEDGKGCLWDYDFKYPGPMTLRYALAGSRNVPAVKANLITGTDKVIANAEKLMNGGTSKSDGFGYNCYYDVKLTREAPCYGASAIGDGAYLHLDEHVNGIASLSREGKYIPRTYIMQITDAAGKNIYQWKQPKGKQVFSQDAAYIIDDILSDPRASYMRGARKFHVQPNGWHFAIKTGTTNDNYDGLMTSWSTKYAAVVWVGNHARNVSLRGVMEDNTGPIMKGWMVAAHKNLKPTVWEKPSSVKTLPAYYMRSGFGTGAIYPSPSKDLFPSNYKPKSGSATGSVTIDKVSNKLATSCTPTSARSTVTGGNANTFSVDTFVAGGSLSSYSGTDDVHNCDDNKPKVQFTYIPTKCDSTNGVVTDCKISILVTSGTHPLSSSKFKSSLVVKINGKVVKTASPGSSTTIYVDYKPTSTGSVKLEASITDSVLYQGSATGQMTTSYTATTTPVTPTTP
ncbi:PBP1A family penicillin-binding protein [soil metagenome]